MRPGGAPKLFRQALSLVLAKHVIVCRGPPPPPDDPRAVQRDRFLKECLGAKPRHAKRARTLRAHLNGDWASFRIDWFVGAAEQPLALFPC
eukprot:11040894-Lingulodinium_polyedra.AAC.1